MYNNSNNNSNTMTIADSIRSHRPNIKDSTLQSYVLVINKLYSLVTDTVSTMPNISFLSNREMIVKKIEDKYKPNTQKNIYNAIVVALIATKKSQELIDFYGAKRDTLHQQYETSLLDNKKTDRQASNWVSVAEIDTLLNKLRERFLDIYESLPRTLEKKELLEAQEYILLATYREIPLRNDVANTQIISNIDTLTEKEQVSENYLVKLKSSYYFLLNNYKTEKTFGQKEIKMSKQLSRYVGYYIKIIKSVLNNKKIYFAYNTRLDPITPNGITKFFTKIFKREFNKNVSTSLLRHIYLSDKYKKDLGEREKDSYKMGHNLTQQKHYIKK